MLRRQDEDVRKLILVFVSFGVTALLMFAWIASFDSPGSRYTASREKNTEKKVESPFSIIRDSVVELYASN